jgi:hypothetical protein
VSRATLAVRFPDGTIKFGLYNGTGDTVVPALVDSIDEAWGWVYDAFKANDAAAYPEPEGPVEDVEVYSAYGRGYWWRGRAAWNAVVSPTDWDGINEVEIAGRPSWYAEAFPGAEF